MADPEPSNVVGFDPSHMADPRIYLITVLGRDPVSCIQKYLTKFDQWMLMAVEIYTDMDIILQITQNNGQLSRFISCAAKYGYELILNWLEQHGVNLTFSNVLNTAARYGQFTLVKSLYTKQHSLDNETMHGAVQSNHLNMVTWLIRHDCPRSTDNLLQAIKHGNISIILALRRSGCDWPKNTGYWAAKHKDPRLLFYVMKNGVYWSNTVWIGAIERNNMKLLDLLLNNTKKLPRDEEACACAAKHGNLRILQLLRQHDFPWDEHTCEKAAEYGHLHVLQWARENGCPWFSGIAYHASFKRHHHIVEWIIKNGGHAPDHESSDEESDVD